MHPGTAAVMPRTSGPLLFSLSSANVADGRVSDARLGRHAVVRADAELAPALESRSERVRADDDGVSGAFLASLRSRFGFLEPYLLRWLSVYGTKVTGSNPVGRAT